MIERQAGTVYERCTCGHLFLIHFTTGGCMYKNGHCPCTTPRLTKTVNTAGLEQCTPKKRSSTSKYFYEEHQAESESGPEECQRENRKEQNPERTLRQGIEDEINITNETMEPTLQSIQAEVQAIDATNVDAVTAAVAKISTDLQTLIDANATPATEPTVDPIVTVTTTTQSGVTAEFVPKA